MSKRRADLDRILAELKVDYLNALPSRIDLLKDLTSKNDWINLKMEYHKLKGTGKTYGFPEISIFCEKLELLAGHKETQKAQLFKDAIGVLQRMHFAFESKLEFDLQKDHIAKAILNVKVKYGS